MFPHCVLPFLVADLIHDPRSTHNKPESLTDNYLTAVELNPHLWEYCIFVVCPRLGLWDHFTAKVLRDEAEA